MFFFACMTLLFVSMPSSAQSLRAGKNFAYLEAGGNGLFGSLNYERQLTDRPGFNLRVGLGYYHEDTAYLTLPVGGSYLFGLKKETNFIEIGFGVTTTLQRGRLPKKGSQRPDNYFISFVPSVGYRRHLPNRLMWRVSLTPIINMFSVTPLIGLSLGKRF